MIKTVLLFPRAFVPVVRVGDTYMFLKFTNIRFLFSIKKADPSYQHIVSKDISEESATLFRKIDRYVYKCDTTRQQRDYIWLFWQCVSFSKFGTFLWKKNTNRKFVFFRVFIISRNHSDVPVPGSTTELKASRPVHIERHCSYDSINKLELM